MSLSARHPERPCAKTGVTLGDAPFEAEQEWADDGRPPWSAWASSPFCPTCPPATPPTT
jgi:hypothetical protein